LIFNFLVRNTAVTVALPVTRQAVRYVLMPEALRLPTGNNRYPRHIQHVRHMLMAEFFFL
jgi:hypothetical protein